jgi:hypothetical protein
VNLVLDWNWWRLAHGVARSCAQQRDPRSRILKSFMIGVIDGARNGRRVAQEPGDPVPIIDGCDASGQKLPFAATKIPGMFGKPSRPSPDCGSAGTSVPSLRRGGWRGRLTFAHPSVPIDQQSTQDHFGSERVLRLRADAEGANTLCEASCRQMIDVMQAAKHGLPDDLPSCALEIGSPTAHCAR